MTLYSSKFNTVDVAKAYREYRIKQGKPLEEDKPQDKDKNDTDADSKTQTSQL